MNGDDDADLFGSDGSEGGFGNEEKYERFYNAFNIKIY
jgi:RNA polymerase-associated protein LEO1